ncbi:UMP kinase [Eubacterium xylanophilum]|uniref:UMP kinase n=1 Tax=Eubacterium xylanophilum TaxID=39497 RepID=UPI00047B845C|nr:UMP kinase [Eubacterium xylanophilum]MCR5798068.1 UMP kinase [Eubacterium sp.]
MKYKRVLLKLSGEALSGDKGTGFDEATCVKVAEQIKKLNESGCEVAIVIGGGNFWRGASSDTIQRNKADQIGMLATVMNCIYMSEICRNAGMMTQVLTPFECGSFTKLFSRDRVEKYFSKNMVVFLAGGTGHPYFSTDTATALRAVEIQADVILAAKSIDGVYDKDPEKYPDAKKYDTLPISRVIDEKLAVVDLASAVLCYENKMPMCLFSLNEENSIINCVEGRCTGTTVTTD